MKKIFRIVSMLTLAGATLVYTGCTDYSSDIDGLKTRVDKLENSTTELKTAAEQIKSLEELTKQLDEASKKATDAIKALEDGIKDADIDAVKADIVAAQKDILALQGKVSTLESDKVAINTAIDALKSGKADQTTVNQLISDLSNVTAQVNTLKGTTESLTTQVTGLTVNIGELKAADKTASDKIAALETSAGELGDEIAELNTKVSALDGNKANVSDVEALEEAIEADITEINKKIDDIKDDIAAVKITVAGKADQNAVDDLADKLNDNVTTLKNSISSINTQIGDILTRLTTAEGKIDKINESLANLDTKKVDATYAATTYATKEAVTEATTDLQKLITALENTCKKYGEDIAGLQTSVADAKAAADEAKTIAKAALTKDQLDEILEGYAKAADLDEKIAALKTALEAEDKTITDDITSKYKDFTDFRDEFDENVIDAINKALGEDGEFDYAALVASIAAVNKTVTDLETAVNKEIDALWKAVDTKVRSIILLSNIYTDGIPTIDYPYTQYYAKEFKNPSTAEKCTYNGVDYYLPSGEAGAQWNYSVASALSSNWPAIPVCYVLNPSSATVTKDSELKVALRDVTIRTRAGVEYNYVATAEYNACEQGMLLVNLQLGTDQVGVPFTPNYAHSDEALLFNLRIVDKDNEGKDSIITSNDGELNVTNSLVETQIVKAEGLTPVSFTSAAGTVRADASVKIDYSDTVGVSIKDLLKVQQKHTVVAGNSTSDEFSDYDIDGNCDTLGLSYEFSLVDYGVQNGKSESSFAKIDSLGVIKACDADGNIGAKAIAAIGRMPLVKALVKDEAGNSLAVAFVKVLVENSSYHVSADTLAVTITTDDTLGDKTGETGAITSKTWDVVAEASVADFTAKYALYESTDYKTKFYAYNGETGEYSLLDGIDYITVNQGTDGKLNVSVTPQGCAKIYTYGGEDHKCTFYVRYVLKKDVNDATVKKEDVIYVPVEITVTRNHLGTIEGKISDYWFGDDKNVAYLNVATPSEVALTDIWGVDLDTYWSGNVPKFTINGEDVTVTVGASAGTAQYKYYFAPVQTTIEGFFGEGEDGLKLVVASTDVYCSDWLGESTPAAADSNAVIAKWETNSYVDCSKGIYTNDKLYAGSVADENVIATIDQVTGVITYNKTELAKKVLGWSASVPKTDCELFANVGIVMCRDSEETNSNIAVGFGEENSTIDQYYFLRPLNDPKPDDEAAHKVSFIDAGAGSNASVSIYDAINVTDWRVGTGNFKNYNYTWYFAYYGFNKIKIGEVTTDLGGLKDPKPIAEVTGDISFKHMLGSADKTETGVTVSWNEAEGSSADTDVTCPLGTADNEGTIADAIEAAFGSLVYTNSMKVVSTAFHIYVTVEAQYIWGSFYYPLEITVNPTYGD